jgi:hypothetical protein
VILYFSQYIGAAKAVNWLVAKVNAGKAERAADTVTELFAAELSEHKLFDRKEVRMCKVCEGDLCRHYSEHCRGIEPNLSIAYYWFRQP